MIPEKEGWSIPVYGVAAEPQARRQAGLLQHISAPPWSEAGYRQFSSTTSILMPDPTTTTPKTTHRYQPDRVDSVKHHTHNTTNHSVQAFPESSVATIRLFPNEGLL